MTEFTYSLTHEQIKKIVQLTINEARSSWNYGEGMDMPVLWIRINRDVLGITETTCSDAWCRKCLQDDPRTWSHD